MRNKARKKLVSLITALTMIMSIAIMPQMIADAASNGDGGNENLFNVNSELFAADEPSETEAPAETNELRFVTDAKLPNASANTPYEADIEAEGGTAPYTYSLVSASLPAGLSLDTSEDGICKIAGTPTVGGYTYSIRINVTDAEGTSVTQTFSITIRANKVTFKIGENSFTYDGTPKTVEVTPYVGTQDASSYINYTVKYDDQPSQTDAGKYRITIVVTSQGYTMGTIDKSYLIINPNNNVRMEFSEDTSFPYDGNPHSPSVKVEGKESDESDWADLSYSVKYIGVNAEYESATPPSFPGMYTMICTVTDSNYATPDSNYVTFEIQHKTVNFTLNDTSAFHVGDTWNRTYEPSDSTITLYTVKYVKDDVEYDAPDSSSTGTYTVKITLDSSYTSIYDVGTISPSTVTVSNKSVDFTLDDTSDFHYGDTWNRTYNSSDANVTDYTVKYEKDGVEYNTPEAAGTYNVKVILDDSYQSKYNVGTITPATVTVLKKSVDFTLDDTSDFYEGSTWNRTYNSSDANVTDYTVKYEKDGVEYNTPEAAGTYTVKIILGDSYTNNYEVGTITPATVTVLGKTIVDFTVTNTSQEYTGSVLYPIISNDYGLKENTDYTVKYIQDGNEAEPKNAGKYTIEINLLSNNKYALGQITPSTFEITKKTVKFLVDNSTWDFDGTEHTPIISTTPTIDPSLYSVTYNMQGGASNLTSIKDEGVYDIVITLTDSDNYQIDETSSKLITVTAAAPKAVLNMGNSPAAQIYNDTNHDEVWQQSAFEYFVINHKFSDEYLPENCSTDVTYNPVGDYDFDIDVNTVIVKDINNFVDPGLVSNSGEKITGSSPVAVSGVDGLYKVTYTYDNDTYERYIIVINSPIGDVNGDGVTNAIDSNYLNLMELPLDTQNIAQARIWDVNMNGQIDEYDVSAIRNRFRKSLLSYYPWL